MMSLLLYVIDKAPFELSQRGRWQMSLIRSRHFDTNMFTDMWMASHHNEQ